MPVDPDVMSEQIKERKRYMKPGESMISEEDLLAVLKQHEQDFEEPMDDSYADFVPPQSRPVTVNPKAQNPQERTKQVERSDRQIFPGGPYQSQVESWKKQYGEVYLTEFDTSAIVWRPLNRFEYKQIVLVQNSDPLHREEMICEVCVLWPENFTFDVMAGDKAGIPAVIAEQIMEKSGFTRSSQPIAL